MSDMNAPPSVIRTITRPSIGLYAAFSPVHVDDYGTIISCCMHHEWLIPIELTGDTFYMQLFDLRAFTAFNRIFVILVYM